MPEPVAQNAEIVRIFDTLTGTQKSAILMMLLGEDEAAWVRRCIRCRVSIKRP
jgi:flagellar motor switch protein FliG